MNLTVQKCYFRAIAAGEKTAEGRIAKEKYLQLRPGDTITFHNAANEEEMVAVRVRQVRRYDSFRAMLEVEGVAAMLPGMTSLDEAIRVYESFGDYKTAVQQYGAVAIRFERVGA